MKRNSLRIVLACLPVPVLATPGPTAAQGTSPAATPLEEICFGDRVEPDCPLWILTDFTYGWRLWTGSRDMAGNAVALWQYGVGARLSDRHALGVVAGFVAEPLGGAYVGRSHRDGGAGYLGPRVSGFAGFLVGAIFGAFVVLMPET